MTRRRKPPSSTVVDKGWAWMIVLGVSLQLFCFAGICKSMGLIAIELVRKFDIPMATAILPATVLFSTYAIASPLAVIAGEIFSIRTVVIFGSLFGFVCILLASFLFSVMYYIIIIGIGIGLGGACYYGNGLILLGKYFRRRRSLANGLGLSGASVGHAIMPPVIEYLLTEFGLAGTTLIISAIFLQGTISGALFRPIRDTYDDNGVIAISDDNISVQEIKVLKDDLATKGDVNSTPSEDPISEHDSLTRFHLQPSSDDKEQTGTSLPQTTGKSLEVKEIESLIPGKDECSHQSSQHLYGSKSPDDVMTSPHYSARSDSNNSFDSCCNDKVSAFHVHNNLERSVYSFQGKQFRQKFSKAVDFSVLKNSVTFYYTAVALLCYFGYMNIVLYFPAIFMDKGLSSRQSAILVLISGAGEIVSRAGIGFLADKNFLPRYVLMGLASCFMGLDIFMLNFVNSFWWAASHSFLYGVSGGTYVCLVVVVLVDLVGLKELNRNMVVVLLIEGVGSALGQPFLGALKDATGSFDIVVTLCSASCLLGGLLEMSYPLILKFENRRLARQQVYL